MALADNLFESPEAIELLLIESESVGDGIEAHEVEAIPSELSEISPEALEVVDVRSVAARGLARARTATGRPRQGGSTSPRTQAPEVSPAAKRHKKKGEDPEEDSVRLYLQEIGKHPLLTKDDEVRLGQTMEKAGKAAAYLNNHPELPHLHREEYAAQVEEGKLAAKEFAQSNLRLVVSIAKNYQASGVPLLDLIQEGNLGLLHAVEKFDYSKGFKFSTYATWWIRQSITRGIANTSRTIRLPVHVGDEKGRLIKAQKRLGQASGHEPTVHELATELDMTPQKVAELMQLGQDPLSIFEPLSEGGDTELGDIIADSTAGSPEEEVIGGLLPQMIQEVLAILDDREREVIVRRFGIGTGIPQTLEDVGEHLHLTRERIRQIEATALGKLRHPANRGILEDLL